ncbi:MAG: putative peptidoglycan glycosyltransferase FtsW [Chloroflexota bacterium]|nr:putative peptidoglycan glycosyltransferase FtsW [Chloroflexota bacterium]
MTASRSRRIVQSDWLMFLVVLILLVVGLVMVYSASYGFALFEGGAYEGRPAHFTRRQGVFALLGLGAMFVTWHIDYHVYRRFAVHILVLTVLMLLVVAPIGRWVIRSRSVQPVEVAKVGAIVYIAVWLSARGEHIRDISLGLIPFALLLGFIAGLIIAQPDFSTAVLLVATGTAMFFVAGADMKQLLIGFLFGGVALTAVMLVASYRSERVQIWLHGPLSDPLGRGFQPIQSLVALNEGGWLGVGLGMSQQKFVLYAPHTDGIFAIIGEELGLVGSVIIIVLYAVWTWRGLRIARYVQEVYGMLLAVGLVCWVTFQAALHIAVVAGLAPFTGTVLPFVSYGGSSLVSCLASVGILLNISQGSAGREGVA